MKRHLLLIASTVLILGAGCAPGQSPPQQAYQEPGLNTSGLQQAPPSDQQLTVDQQQDQQAPPPQQPSQPESSPKPPVNQQWKFPGALPAAEISNKQIHITTAKGDIVFQLFDQDAPKTVSNFVYLTKGGFYDGLTFHRREEGFVIQGGDPNGDGTGGPGYQFEDEKVTRKYDRGIVAMANAGPNTNGSQFFIMLANYPLPPQYTIFGQVTSGMDVVDKIAVGDVMTQVTVEDRK